MLRRFGAGVAVAALLSGFSAAPYTHAHHAIEALSDDHHAAGHTLVHTHATPHSHHHADDAGQQAAGKDAGDEAIWSVDSFVFQQPVPNHAPIPVLLVFGELHVELTCVWLGACRLQPRAHGPPVTFRSTPRAPPAFPPTFA